MSWSEYSTALMYGALMPGLIQSRWCNHVTGIIYCQNYIHIDMLSFAFALNHLKRVFNLTVTSKQETAIHIVYIYGLFQMNKKWRRIYKYQPE